MDHNMFCFQCEQTAGCTGCTSRGVCGKDAQTAQAQDRLTGALIGLARAADTSPDAGPETWQLMIEGLFATLTNVNFDPDSLNALAGRVRAEKQRKARAGFVGLTHGAFHAARFKGQRPGKPAPAQILGQIEGRVAAGFIQCGKIEIGTSGDAAFFPHEQGKPFHAAGKAYTRDFRASERGDQTVVATSSGY